MTREPRTTDDIYNTLRKSLSRKITKISNFTEQSFNYVFTRAISGYFREAEIELLAAELSGYIDYAGGPITDEDLRRLGVSDSLDPEEINSYMYDNDLDNLVELVGVERKQGTKATGFIDVTTVEGDKVEVPPNMVVSTQPDFNGNVLSYTIDSNDSIIVPEGTPVGVDIPVIAEEVGEDYNIPNNQLIRIENPEVGIKQIESSTAMSGGKSVESNDSLRERAKQSLIETPDGGTVRGIKSNIYKNVDGVDEEQIGVTELFDKTPTLVEVTVDGGDTERIESEIEDGRPVGVKHELLRPIIIQLSVDAQLFGDEVNIQFVENEIENYLLESLNVGDNFYRKELIRQIMESDSNILNIDSLEVSISNIENERFRFDDTKSKYKLSYTYDGDSITIYNKNNNIFEQGVDYTVIDDTTDGISETIEWLGVDEPEDDENFFVDYTVTDDTTIQRDEEHIHQKDYSETITYESSKEEYLLDNVPLNGNVTVSGFTQGQGEDYEIQTRPIETDEVDNLVYSSGRSNYRLNRSVYDGHVTVYIPNGQTFEKNADYELQDSNNDGLDDTIVWLDGGATPSDSQTFEVEYDVDNGIKQTLVWLDGGTAPSVGDEFNPEYEIGVYGLDKEVVNRTDENVSCNCPSSNYELDTDFKFVDADADGEYDSLQWLPGGVRPSDDVAFYVTYVTEGDIVLDERQKIDASKVTITEV